MKTPFARVLALLVLLNCATLAALFVVMNQGRAARAQYAAAEPELMKREAAAVEQVQRAEFRLATAEHVVASLRAATDPITGKVAIDVVKEWQKLYEDTSLPLKVGDKIEFYTITEIAPDHIAAEYRKAVKTFAWADVPVAWRARVAITLLDARQN